MRRGRAKRYCIAFVILMIIITVIAAVMGAGGFLTCLMYGFFISLFILVGVWACVAAIRRERGAGRSGGMSYTTGRGNNISDEEAAWAARRDQCMKNAGACRQAGNYDRAKMWENEANK